MVSDPDLNHARECLEKTEFVVVQDLFLTETAQLAHVVLPGASFAEKDGTFTNTERRVQRVRKALSPVAVPARTGRSSAIWPEKWVQPALISHLPKRSWRKSTG
jgi:predicted molibdopterin-dependent oxidoreductase YjgC